MKIIGLFTLLSCFIFGLNGQQNLPNTLAPIVEKVIDGIIQIDVLEDLSKKPDTENAKPFFDYFFDNPDGSPKKDNKAGFLGSGVIIKKAGKVYYALTNNHVAGEAVNIKVTLNNGDTYDAKLVGKDLKRDLALVSFESDQSLNIISIANSDSLRVGDFVLAIGSPYGYQSSVSFGIVSGLHRRGGPENSITDYIQTDAAINKGNSGGALLNLEGKLVGINTWITSQSGGSVGIGFAVPSNETIKVIDDLIAYGQVKAPWFGINMFTLDEKISKEFLNKKVAGVLVSGLYLNSPAGHAGLLPGDIIVKINEKSVDSTEALSQSIASKSSKEKIRIEIIRKNKNMSIIAGLEPRPEDAALNDLGATIWPGFAVYPLTYMTEEILAELKLEKDFKGLIVRQVIAKSRADKANLKFSDLISKINGKVITDLKEFYSYISSLGSEASYVLEVNRQGKNITITIPGK